MNPSLLVNFRCLSLVYWKVTFVLASVRKLKVGLSSSTIPAYEVSWARTEAINDAVFLVKTNHTTDWPEGQCQFLGLIYRPCIDLSLREQNEQSSKDIWLQKE